MRLSIDVGGTFTDILLTSSGGKAAAFKASTTYPDPIEGIVAGLQLAAASRGFSVETLLGETESLFHSTTRAINAVVTGNVARTGLLVTQGHPDILLIREGGANRSVQLQRTLCAGLYFTRAHFRDSGARGRKRPHRQGV